MKKLQTKLCIAMMLLFLLVNAAGATKSMDGMKESAPANEPNPAVDSSTTSEEDGAATVIGDLLGEITVPNEAAILFNDLYYRNKAEVFRILNNNPYLVWETLGVVVEALPALRLIGDQDGKLYLDRATYARARSLFDHYHGLASPQLAADLDKTRSYVDSRTEEKDSGDVVIHLNDFELLPE
jgi:hypothetical protein